MTVADAEFSHVVVLADLPRGGASFRLAANEEERARITKRLDVVAVKHIEGAVKIRANRAEIFLTGTLLASLTRECVASLDEMAEDIAEDFELVFLRGDATPAEGDEEAALPDIHEGAEFDIGDFLVQQLSLAMDPFPRKDGVTSLAEQYGQDEEKTAFAAALGEAKKIE
ncbi:MAG: DUF177 domain-containing protein [Marinicaulis sp.]|nr:DUF177 domain-containing protein [Marinicaulis sp.]NNE40504.1 DUF177 domain-containing protein [Marinicaulis sp.]NNL89540.1 DUF177 domain-containing protein [Marinicaulis sp.]